MGARTRAWQDFLLMSTAWRMEMAKVAVFPVPDCAWAITSRPDGRGGGGKERAGRTKKRGKVGRREREGGGWEW